MHIIPAIDVIDGKCVRLTQGDFNQKKIYNEHPLEVAMQFQDAGLTKLHLVDLDGAREKRIINWKVLEKVANGTDLEIDFGGGLRSDKDIEVAFECGAKQVTAGSIAVTDQQLFERWMQKYGNEKIILGADTRNGFISVNGWKDVSKRRIFPFLQEYKELGAKYVISTDIAKDGLMQGPSFDLYAEINKEVEGLSLIASGGVTVMKDLEKLQEMGLYGAITGKALYEGTITLKDIRSFILKNA